MSDPASRAVLETAYNRLVASLEARQSFPAHLKSAALDALARAKELLENDPDGFASELDRINDIAAGHSDDEHASADDSADALVVK